MILIIDRVKFDCYSKLRFLVAMKELADLRKFLFRLRRSKVPEPQILFFQ